MKGEGEMAWGGGKLESTHTYYVYAASALTLLGHKRATVTCAIHQRRLSDFNQMQSWPGSQGGRRVSTRDGPVRGFHLTTADVCSLKMANCAGCSMQARPNAKQLELLAAGGWLCLIWLTLSFIFFYGLPGRGRGPFNSRGARQLLSNAWGTHSDRHKRRQNTVKQGLTVGEIMNTN